MPASLSELDLLPGRCFGTFRLPDEVSFIASHGSGSRLWSTDGKEFVDYVIGSGPMIVGHAHPQVVDAVSAQVRRGTTFYVMNDMAPQLAGRIVRMVPSAEAVKFVSDGTEATLYAMRFARAFTGRTRVLKFEGAYHGHHDYALHGLKQRPGINFPEAVADSAGIPDSVSDTVLIAPYNDLEAVRALVRPVAGEMAAIIVEPVQRSIDPLPGFLAGLRALCDEIGALLIFDEVVTGFRLALGGGQEVSGVMPDLTTLGKAIGGGLPLAALAGRRDILDLSVPELGADRYVYISGTLNGNPLAAAAGIATLDILEAENGPEKLRQHGERIREGFTTAAAELSIPFQMIGPAAIPEPLFDTGPITDYRSYNATNRQAVKQFGVELIKRGILMNPISKLYMSITLDDEAIERTISAGKEAMQAVRDLGLIKG